MSWRHLKDMALSIALVGDVMLGRSFDRIYNLRNKGPKSTQSKAEKASFCWIDRKLKLWLEESDLLIGNLETAITDTPEEDKFPNKVFNFKISPSNFRLAAECLRFNYLSLGNNHSLDYGLGGLEQTIETLDEVSIFHAGSAIAIKDVKKPQRITVFPSVSDDGDKRTKEKVEVSIFSASTHPSAFSPHVWISEDLKDVIAAVRTERKSFKGVIICSLHWSPNYLPEPDEQMKAIGHELIHAGANIIHGHSAHHLLPMEFYENGVIFYSLGDFIDDYAIDDTYRNDLSAVVKVSLRIEEGYIIEGVEMVPTRIESMKVSATRKDTREFRHSLDILDGKKRANQPP